MELRPSRLLAGVLLFAHGLAIVAIWQGLDGWSRYLAGTAVAASLWIGLARALFWAGAQPLALELRDDGRGSWKDRRGEWHEGSLGKSHFVSTLLIVLELEYGGFRPKRVVLLPDSAPPDELRRLRVWLRWRRNPAIGRNNLTGD